jgi:MoxR-like ATPase
MLEIRMAEATGDTSRESLAQDIFDRRFLISRPLLQALEPHAGGAPVLLIDELDRTDEPFEAFLLEVLSDYQITIPEVGTIKAATPPITIITSNRTREIHDALKRRCFYHWVDYPTAEREHEIIKTRLPGRRRAPVADDRRLRPGAEKEGPLQAAGRRRDAGLDAGADHARRPGPDPGGHPRHARHLLKYQDDIAKIQGSEAANILREISMKAQAAGRG